MFFFFFRWKDVKHVSARGSRVTIGLFTVLRLKDANQVRWQKFYGSAYLVAGVARPACHFEL